MKKSIYILMIIICFAACGCAKTTKQIDFANRICSVNEGNVDISELTDFKWDKGYIFSAYTDKEDIEEIIGFDSKKVVSVTNSDSDEFIVFVKNNKVVYSVMTSELKEVIGFEFRDKERYISFDYNKCTFSVKNEKGIKYFRYN